MGEQIYTGKVRCDNPGDLRCAPIYIWSFSENFPFYNYLLASNKRQYPLYSINLWRLPLETQKSFDVTQKNHFQ